MPADTPSKVSAAHPRKDAYLYLLTELPKGSFLLRAQSLVWAGTFPARDSWMG
jgi:hypothetical protein